MADIQIRFNKDMLVLTSPVEDALARLGMTNPDDCAYTLLFEPEVIEEIYKLEAITGAQCVVADSALLTPARLAQVGMGKDAQAMAQHAMDIAASVKPQHLLVEIAPCGLPLDAASKASLVENRDQYSSAARLFTDAETAFDAFFLNGFSRVADLKCALMGIRRVSDKPIIASVPLDENGVLVRKATYGAGANLAPLEETIEEAAAAMADLGADVAGFATAAAPDTAVQLLDRIHAACDLPTLVQLDIRHRDPEQEAPTPDNPYCDPDTMVDAADVLRDAGAQFLRAIGDVTPAYTGALVAATDKLDVVRVVGRPHAVFDESTDLDELADTLRARIASAMGKASGEGE